MGVGNGHERLLSMRWLRTIWRRPPKGPFTGEDAARVLAAEGWQVLTGPPNEWRTYGHPDKPDARVTININWDAFFENGVIFQVLARQMGITGKRLVWLLGR